MALRCLSDVERGQGDTTRGLGVRGEGLGIGKNGENLSCTPLFIQVCKNQPLIPSPQLLSHVRIHFSSPDHCSLTFSSA